MSTPGADLERQIGQTMREHSRQVSMARAADWLESSPERSPRRSWAPWLIAAVAIGAIASGVVMARSAGPPNPQPPGNPAPSTDARPDSPFDSMVISIGDKVEAVGPGGIGQRANGTLVLCGLGYGAAGTETPLTGDCSVINTQAIAQLRPADGVSLSPSLTKPVSITGTYQGNGVILVTSSTPAAVSRDIEDPTPCPTPASGWPDRTDDAVLLNYIRQHSSEFVPLRYTNPSVTSSVKVATVGTTLDPDNVRSHLVDLYSGPLCVYHTSQSQMELSQARGQALAVMQRLQISVVPIDRNNIGNALPIDYTTGRTPINVALLTAEAAQELTPLADAITLTASVRPASE